jgi:signal transduction histidine kinase
MLFRLDEIEDDLIALQFLRTKREETKRLARIAPIDLGIPGVPSKDSA